MIDVETGYVFEGIKADAFFEYYPDSELMIVNPSGEDGETLMYYWDVDHFALADD